MAQDILLGARMRVEETLSERRARHVFAVDREMHALCREFGLGEEEEKSLSLIALLHDITKEKDTQTQLKMCLEYGIILSDADRAVEKGLHAITGAALEKADGRPHTILFTAPPAPPQEEDNLAELISRMDEDEVF